MSSLRSWFRGTPAPPAKESPDSSSGASSTAADGAAEPSAAEREISDMEDAMAAAGMIMNDDIDGAEDRLKLRKDGSAFHQLGLGVSTFMRSILGFERSIMAEASTRLLDCESRAWADMRKAQKEASGGWFGRGSSAAAASASAGTISQIYPPGTEFALVHAEAQLMGAVVAVMHESLTDAIKGFYKLRKAFITLDGIMETEDRLLKAKGGDGANGAAARRPSFSEDKMPGSFDDDEFDGLVETGHSPDEPLPSTTTAAAAAVGTAAGEESIDALDRILNEAATTPTPSTLETPLVELLNLTVDQDGDGDDGDDGSGGGGGGGGSKGSTTPGGTSGPTTAPRCETPLSPPTHHDHDHGPDSSLFTHPVDIFVHSGANMCFGILLLILSMVPPAFSRVLYIIGFKGDRDRGVRMLWQSTKFANINGAVAGLILLSYYNGLVAFADILPAEADIEKLAAPGEVVGLPAARCRRLLDQMRTRYPRSRLWQLEEARALANDRDLDAAMAALQRGGESRMRQVTALNTFELALHAMYALRWDTMRDAFLRCIELNDWSHCLYYYLAGCAEVEMYRDAAARAAEISADGDDNDDDDHKRRREEALAEAETRKRAATKLLRHAPTVAGRKKIMTRQMPFEVYTLRKIARWEERAAALGVDLVDAVGVSPTQEMVYLWNGSKRMPPDVLEKAAACLGWERCTAGKEQVDAMKAIPDESAIKGLAESAILRRQGKLTEARKLLDDEVLKYDRSTFKGLTKDDYVLAAGHYEVAVIAWQEACDPKLYPADGAAAVTEYRKQKINECQRYLEKVTKWETFVLDARIGMRVQAGMDAVKWLKGKMNWS